jgi:hypothetical protein
LCAVQVRNRKVFGILLGHLGKAKKEAESEKEAEAAAKRREVERKAEERARKHRSELLEDERRKCACAIGANSRHLATPTLARCAAHAFRRQCDVRCIMQSLPCLACCGHAGTG